MLFYNLILEISLCTTRAVFQFAIQNQSLTPLSIGHMVTNPDKLMAHRIGDYFEVLLPEEMNQPEDVKIETKPSPSNSENEKPVNLNGEKEEPRVILSEKDTSDERISLIRRNTDTFFYIKYVPNFERKLEKLKNFSLSNETNQLIKGEIKNKLMSVANETRFAYLTDLLRENEEALRKKIMPGSERPKDSSLSLGNPLKSLDNPSKSLDNPSKSLENPSKSLDNPSKSLDNSSKSLDNPSKSLDNSSKSLDNSSKSLENPSKSLENPLENNKEVSDMKKKDQKESIKKLSSNFLILEESRKISNKNRFKFIPIGGGFKLQNNKKECLNINGIELYFSNCENGVILELRPVTEKTDDTVPLLREYYRKEIERAKEGIQKNLIENNQMGQILREKRDNVLTREIGRGVREEDLQRSQLLKNAPKGRTLTEQRMFLDKQIKQNESAILGLHARNEMADKIKIADVGNKQQ